MEPGTTEPLDVLVVEDDAQLSSVIERALARQGHRVRCVDRGDSAVSLTSAESFDVVVLDVTLPGMDGLTACRRMRELGIDATIIMLTARTQVDDRIAGLDAGADDYLGKPFALRELYARMRATRRRAARRSGDTLVVGPLTLHLDELACEREGIRIELRAKEAAILEHLMRNHGLVVTRDRLLDAVWHDEADHHSNAIDAQIKRLRARVDRPFATPLIHTVRGVGYRLAP